jgi:hypothetical protein
MTNDPFAIGDELDSALDFALGDGAPRPALDFDIPIATEAEEIEVRDATGRVIGVIDLS